MMKVLKNLLKDYQLSVKSEAKLDVGEYKRISSRLTPYSKLLSIASLLFVFSFFYKLIIEEKYLTYFKQSGENFGLIFLLITIIVIFYVSVISLKCLSFKPIFYSDESKSILVFDVFKNRVHTFNIGDIEDIYGTTFTKIDLVTIKTCKKRKFYFLGTFRIGKFLTEHPIAYQLRKDFKL